MDLLAQHQAAVQSLQRLYYQEVNRLDPCCKFEYFSLTRFACKEAIRQSESALDKAALQNQSFSCKEVLP